MTYLQLLNSKVWALQMSQDPHILSSHTDKKIVFSLNGQILIDGDNKVESLKKSSKKIFNTNYFKIYGNRLFFSLPNLERYVTILLENKNALKGEMFNLNGEQQQVSLTIESRFTDTEIRQNILKNMCSKLWKGNVLGLNETDIFKFTDAGEVLFFPHDELANFLAEDSKYRFKPMKLAYIVDRYKIILFDKKDYKTIGNLEVLSKIIFGNFKHPDKEFYFPVELKKLDDKDYEVALNKLGEEENVEFENWEIEEDETSEIENDSGKLYDPVFE